MERAQPIAAGVQHHRCHLRGTGRVAEPALAAAATTQLLIEKMGDQLLQLRAISITSAIERI